MTDQELSEQFLTNIRADIISKSKSLGQEASGKTYTRIRSVSTSLGGILFGPQHIFALDRGRGPTRGGGGGTGKSLRQKIYEWLAFQKYGLTWKDNKEREGLSWGISKNIHKKGTSLFRRGGSGLLSDIVTSQRLDALTGAFADNKSAQFKTEILKNFKGARQA